MGYNDIREALRRDFLLENLHLITRLGHELLNSDTPLRHPAAAYVIAATAQKVAWYLEEGGLQDDSATVVGAHIRPRMEAVLDAAEGEPTLLIQALDDLARAYADATRLIQSPEP